MIPLDDLIKQMSVLAEKQYEERVQLLTTHLRKEIVSECKRKGLFFRAGNGAWCCFHVKDRSVADDKLSAKLTAILNMVLDSDPYNNIGSLLEDYG